MIRRNAYRNFRKVVAGFVALALILSCPGIGAAGKVQATGDSGREMYHTEAFDISNYQDDKAPKPQMEEYKDWLFSGWFSDKTCVSGMELKEKPATGTCYAKFVPEEVLSVKCQITDGLSESSEELGKLRIVSTVDSLRYQNVGFEIRYGNNEVIKHNTKTVYEKILATNGVPFTYEPSVFSDVSKYFITATLVNIPTGAFDTGVYIAPYWVTMDGTLVYGVSRYARVEDGYLNIVNVPVRLYSDEAVAAGYLEIDYDEEKFVYYPNEDGSIDLGNVFGEMEVVDIEVNGNRMIRCAGNVKDITENKTADGLYVNLRFQAKNGIPSTDETFTVSSESFCNNQEEINKDFAVSDVVYKGISTENGIEPFGADEAGATNVQGIDENAADAALKAPKVLLNPTEEEYQDGKRQWQGIPGIAKDNETGRLWATWYSGGSTEDEYNWSVLYTSEDDGQSWSGPKVVVDPEYPVRSFDPNLWVDPSGRMWFIWNQSYYHFDGRCGVWAMYTDNPGEENPTWSEPVRIANGIAMNDPIVLKNGDWILPTAIWGWSTFEEMGIEINSNAYISKDKGATWSYLGSVPGYTGARNCDENMIIEQKDGTLRMLIRTGYGVEESYSKDGGKTWSCSELAGISNVASRFYITRLASGNQLLVYNDPPSGDNVRTHMTAAISTDDGKTWSHRLVIDERAGSTYPDAQQDKDGNIYIVYDHGRSATGEILMAKITEADIMAGRLVTDGSRLKVLVNDNGASDDTRIFDVEIEKKLARVESNDGIMEKLTEGAALFSDRPYAAGKYVPGQLTGKGYLKAPMNTGAAVTVTEDGWLYVLTPNTGASNQMEKLTSQGFALQTTLPKGQICEDLEEELNLLKKEVTAGETYTFGKWGILIGGMDVYASAVVLDQTVVTMSVGRTESLQASVIPVDMKDPTVKWSSSEPSVATVDEKGVVTAVAPGRTVVFAVSADGRAQARCRVNVKAATSNDINGDGQFDIRDIVRMKQYLHSPETVMIYAADKGDLDGNGATDGEDLALLRQNLVNGVGILENKGSVYGEGISILPSRTYRGAEYTILEKMVEDGGNAGKTYSSIEDVAKSGWSKLTVKARKEAGLKANTKYQVAVDVECDGVLPSFYEEHTSPSKGNDFVFGAPGGKITFTIVTDENGEFEKVWDTIYLNAGQGLTYVDFTGIELTEMKRSVYGEGIAVSPTLVYQGAEYTISEKTMTEGENVGKNYNSIENITKSGKTGLTVSASSEAGLRANTEYQVTVTVECDGSRPSFFEEHVGGNDFVFGAPGGEITFTIVTDKNGEFKKEWYTIWLNGATYVNFTGIQLTRSAYAEGVDVQLVRLNQQAWYTIAEHIIPEGETVGKSCTSLESITKGGKTRLIVSASQEAGLKANTNYQVVVSVDCDGNRPSFYETGNTFVFGAPGGEIVFNITTDANGEFKKQWDTAYLNDGNGLTYVNFTDVAIREAE